MDTATVALIGAITGIIGMTFGGIALCWDIYKWRVSRVKIKSSIFFQVQTDGLEGQLPKGEYYGIEIINRSDRQTTIEDMTLCHYSNFLTRIQGRRVTEFIRNAVATLPAKIGPNEIWTASFPREEYYTKKALKGYLYLNVRHSASDKPIVARIRF